MNDTIYYFMWGFQKHFRSHLEYISKRVFELLDERIDPQVFLVGILIDDRKDQHPACVEPEQDFWIKSSDFNNVLSMATDIEKGYPEGLIQQTHPVAQEQQDEELWYRSIKDTISRIIEEHPERPAGFLYNVSYPAEVEGYLVCAVIGIQKSIIEEHPSLNISSVPIHEYRSMPVPTSLIDAVAHRLLDKASGELRVPNPGQYGSDINAEEIVRDGAHRLMKGLAYRADRSCLGWDRFFSSCTNIAQTYYEGSAGDGALVLCRKDHPGLERVVPFKKYTQLHVTRAARKLLQLASRGLVLHTNSKFLFGLVNIGNYVASDEDLFTVEFIEHHHWKVLHNSQVLMGVKYGQPYLPKPMFDEEKLKVNLQRIFKSIKEKQIDRILSLVHAVESENHGTMLVICSGAKQEAERLATECTPINPKILTPELLINLTPIDGAVLMNQKGTCYAIGVILDGIASKCGDPARGARYNSAIRYVTSCKFPTLTVIVSEDGGVSFYPKLTSDE